MYSTRARRVVQVISQLWSWDQLYHKEKVCHSRFQVPHVEQKSATRTHLQPHSISTLPRQNSEGPFCTSRRTKRPRHFHSSSHVDVHTLAIRNPANHNQHCTMRTSEQSPTWLDTERGVPSARQTTLSHILSPANTEAPASVPIVPDAHGSPRHPGPSIQGSFHISRTASSFHGFEQNATNPYCPGQFSTDHLRFQQTWRPPQQPCPPICKF